MLICPTCGQAGACHGRDVGALDYGDHFGFWCENCGHIEGASSSGESPIADSHVNRCSLRCAEATHEGDRPAQDLTEIAGWSTGLIRAGKNISDFCHVLRERVKRTAIIMLRWETEFPLCMNIAAVNKQELRHFGNSAFLLSVLITALASGQPAAPQSSGIDLTGSWAAIGGGGDENELVDYAGEPLNEAARLYALAWNPAWSKYANALQDKEI